jgi:molybdopterin synthase catalytic subunit
MDLDQMIQRIKEHPNFHQAGMILCHNGVVRSTSRDGRSVRGLSVAVDRQRLKDIVAENKRQPGIVDILVEIFDDRPLAVGDDVMYLVVAGDIRETVIDVLSRTLDAIKTTVTRKHEIIDKS